MAYRNVLEPCPETKKICCGLQLRMLIVMQFYFCVSALENMSRKPKTEQFYQAYQILSFKYISCLISLKDKYILVIVCK